MSPQPTTDGAVITSGVHVPRRLHASEPGWQLEADVIVVGSGIAGLTTALKLRQRVSRVLLVTKTVLDSGSTMWAQGGIAAALAPEDSPDEHLSDTLVAGAGLCDAEAVRVLVTEGPERVRDLIDMGAQFDTAPDGQIALTREGGHHRDRIAHAGGDATGAEISRALIAALRAVHDDPGIEVIEHALVLDVLTAATEGSARRAVGVTLHVIGEGQRDGIGSAHARAVVLATGGIGQVFASTTNPREATGDGTAAALRAGAQIADLEFVQFHPTVLWLGSGARGQQTLISEAVRGEGAYLLNSLGQRFMKDQHELAELAPRDVVAKAIVREMAAQGSDHVYLDARHLGRAFLAKRFPTIVQALAEHGFDLAEDPVPVAPAQHYHSGGVLVDQHGRSSLDGLYAVGETSCTGVHGANRLASNSLLEGLVFAHRIAQDITTRLNNDELPWLPPNPEDCESGLCASDDDLLLSAVQRSVVQTAASSGPGVIRSAPALRQSQDVLGALVQQIARGASPATAEWEASNIYIIASALTQNAMLRQETRGGHYRADFPTESEQWRGRLVSWRQGGTLVSQFRPLQDDGAAIPSSETDTPS